MAGVVYREVYPMSPFEARKRLVQTYQQTGSVRRTAALWHTSRQVVRKWVRRYEQDGEDGLHDRSCRPDHCPHQTREATEEPGRRGTESHRLWARTPGPLSRSARGPGLSPYHPSHPASSSLTREKHKRRKPLYPAHWAWNVKEPFALIQTDAKDILDKGALETRRWQHIRTQHLLRYQWTACDGRTRLHFLAYSHHLNRTNGVAFMVLVLLWLRAHGVGASVTVQTDWERSSAVTTKSRSRNWEHAFLPPCTAPCAAIRCAARATMAASSAATAPTMRSSTIPTCCRSGIPPPSCPGLLAGPTSTTYSARTLGTTWADARPLPC
jgi:hypothetical protein